MATKMTASEITERINKVKEAIAKKEKSIARLEKEIANWTGSQYMKECKMDDLRRRNQEKEEKQQTMKNWQTKLETLIAEDRKISRIPEQLETLRKQVVEDLIEWATDYREQMKEDRKNLTHEEFYTKYSWSEYYKYYYITDEDIRKDAEKEAKYWVLDLISRVEKKCGQITKWDLHLDIDALNGWVEGTKGNAEIETIFAGGWNIQRLHTRVLVK